MATNKIVGIDEIHLSESSIKRQNDIIYHLLKNYIQEHGQLQSIVVYKRNDKYEIIKGRMVYRALSELEMPFAIVCDLGEIPVEEAKIHYLKLALLRKEIDSVELAFLLKDLFGSIDKRELSKVVPLSMTELEALEKIFNFDWERYKTEDEKNQLKMF